MSIEVSWLPLLQTVATLVVVVLVWLTLQHRSDGPPQHRSVAIVVLGDIGRSPRTMYHAQSFANNEFETYIVGYQGSREVASLLTLPRIRFIYLPALPSFISKLPRRLFLFLAPLKVMFQLATILVALFSRIDQPPEFILVQNPPSIPTLALVWLAGKVRGSKIIIDWHNLGYSILALKLGDKHVLVRLAKKFEKTFGRSAYAHLFVTKAMRDHLVHQWGLQGRKIVLHDRPPAHFHRCSPSEVHELLLRLMPSLLPSLSTFLPPSSPPKATPLTSLTSPASPSPTSIYPSPPFPILRPDRPALVISSTSWTEDEDFDLLIHALSLYEQRARRANAGLPKVLMLVTGKGPLRETYMREVHRREEEEDWAWVRCRSMWLEAEDYPLLLGAADLGVSLHASSSSLDLPMKVVDMFGCGLPVLALDFACLDELVLNGKNGLIFRTAEELASQMADTLTGFPSSPRLAALNAFFSRGTGWDWCTWAENWDRVMRPVVTHEGVDKDAWLEELYKQRDARVK